MSIHRNHNSRLGMALLAALVAMAVTSAILIGVLQGATTLQRQLRTHRQQLQARYLVDAGIHRAIAKLRDSADYRGETWSISADELDGSSPAEVVIRIDELEREPDRFQVAVQADYPHTEFHRARESRIITVAFP